ncbi:hypothetical protein J6590_005074 [Homalodisca vitripennis]|nr:hypothetical protein J6590_005074 [Homalodisca vitripennis]
MLKYTVPKLKQSVTNNDMSRSKTQQTVHVSAWAPGRWVPEDTVYTRDLRYTYSCAPSKSAYFSVMRQMLPPTHRPDKLNPISNVLAASAAFPYRPTRPRPRAQNFRGRINLIVHKKKLRRRVVLALGGAGGQGQLGPGCDVDSFIGVLCTFYGEEIGLVSELRIVLYVVTIQQSVERRESEFVIQNSVISHG